MRQTIEYDLHKLLDKLVVQEAGVTELYVFGSRAYGTGSRRSDCDILVRVDLRNRIMSSDPRDFATKYCPALDFFIAMDGHAISATNDSYVSAATFDILIDKLDAVRLWTRMTGFEEFAFAPSGDWTFKVAANVEFIPSVLPDNVAADLAWASKIRIVESQGLPARPFIGDTAAKAAAFLIEVARRMILEKKELGPRGCARGGWTVNLQSEYDCQNLFFLIVKPWLPNLGREEITIYFDGQKKQGDYPLDDRTARASFGHIDTRQVMFYRQMKR